MYDGDGTDFIYPICLPPHGPVLWDMLTAAAKDSKFEGYKAMWYENAPDKLVPFEDMDCVHTLESQVGVNHVADVLVRIFDSYFDSILKGGLKMIAATKTGMYSIIYLV